MGEWRKGKKKPILFCISILVLVVFVAYVSFHLYRKEQLEKNEIKSQIFYQIETNGLTDHTQITYQWLNGFLKQYQNQYLDTRQKIEEFSIDNVSVIHEKKRVVEVTFHMTPKDENTTYFDQWKGTEEGNSIVCKWVMVLNQSQSNTLQLMAGVTTFVSAEQYYKNPNVLQYSFAKLESNQYQIKNKELFVSFNASNVWTPVQWNRVPIDVTTLETDRSGSNIQEGTYQIEKHKIVFVTKLEKGINLVFSDDQGKSWDHISIKNSKALNITTCMEVFFSDAKNGLVVVGLDNVAMGEIETAILRTTDAGVTWNYVGAGPSGGVDVGSDIAFLTQDIGFISSAKGGMLQRTEDGGKTWKEVILPKQVLQDDQGIYTWETVYTYPQIPTLEEDILKVLVYQGTTQDYQGGKTVAVYQSKDMGRTWSYVDEIRTNE